MVKGSEEARKEEYFGGNEQDYSVSEAFLYGGCVVALECSFTNNISSSLVYSEGCKE